LSDGILLLSSFGVILAGALLFTNAVEWLGNRLEIAEGATGSLLAAVGTAMPETLIPVVALLEDEPDADGVAIGAIIGAPFLLATVAMMLVGLSALAYRHRREQSRKLAAHAPTLERDLGFFLISFTLALALGLGAASGIQIAAAVGFVGAYGLYVRLTLRGSGAVQRLETISPLVMSRSRSELPSLTLIVVQFLVGLAAMVGGAHLFVEELVAVADSIGVEVLVLSLVLAPLATELPEKANSFFWVREGKDTLALGNITGAMVFQSTIPVAVGLAFTDWDLDRFAVLSVALGLGGGIVAYWALRLRQSFELPAIFAWGCLYSAFLVTVIVTA
jgi:cation:H+ antiporter